MLTCDIQRLLGTPKGSGWARLPIDPRPREVWLYDDMAITGMRWEGGGVMRGDVRQQMLLVFFHQERYDGHL